MIETFDKAGLEFFNSLTSSPAIKEVVYLMADYPIFFLPIFLITAWLYHTFKAKNPTKKKEKLLWIFYWVVTSVVFNVILQQFVHRDRPETFLENKANFTLSHIPDASFPSDHASVAIAFLTGLYIFGYKKTATIIAPLFVLMLLSRVAGWVHWPTDIISWAIVWIIFPILIKKAYKKGYLNKINKFVLILDFTKYFRK